MKKKNLSTEFQDLEGTQFSITFNPHWNKFNIGITDSCGGGTNSIVIGYEDLRSIFKEAENIMIQNTDLIMDEKSFPKPNVED
jgi:hypothetical protein